MMRAVRLSRAANRFEFLEAEKEEIQQMPYLKTYFDETVLPEMMQSQGYGNRHEVPRIEKVVINSGVGTSLDKSAIEETAGEVALVAGQKPVITLARKSISNFKLREGYPVGVKVTLRGNSMYEFLYRLLSVALPGIRDFRGVSTRFDGNGNYTLGITDHTIFPEVNMDSRRRTIGMDICIVTTAGTDEEGTKLLELMGMPFRRRS
jgi:large subunit ribosomal protein L5